MEYAAMGLPKPLLRAWPHDHKDAGYGGKEASLKKLVCILLVAGLLSSCGGRKSRVDKVTEDGIEVVLNHLEPYKIKGEASRLILKEDVRLDLEKSEYSGLGLKEPFFAEADGEGNIYLVEFYQDSEYLLYKFAGDGKFLKRFGKKGQGPGELQWVSALVVEPNGHVLVSDMGLGKVIEFDGEANIAKETKVNYALREVVPLKNGHYLGRKNASDPRGMALCLFDADFNELKRLDFVDMSDIAPGKRTPGTIMAFPWLVAGDRIYIGNEQRGYDIWVYDLDGQLVRKIRKEFKPAPYPEEFKKQTEELAARQPALNLYARSDTPPFNSFFTDDEGRLLVMTYERDQNTGDYIHDVYDKDGVLIARVPIGASGILARALNPLRATAKNGRYYRLVFKENGYPEVIVYRMAWD